MAKELTEAEAQRLEKLKILQSTLDKIEKNYGKGSVMKLGDRAAEKVDVIPTGSINLDMALGVGGPRHDRAGRPVSERTECRRHLPALRRGSY